MVRALIILSKRLRLVTAVTVFRERLFRPVPVPRPGPRPQAHCTKYGNSKRRERLQLTSKFHVLTFFSRAPLRLYNYVRTDRSLTSIVVIPIYADTAWPSSVQNPGVDRPDYPGSVMWRHRLSVAHIIAWTQCTFHYDGLSIHNIVCTQILGAYIISSNNHPGIWLLTQCYFYTTHNFLICC